MADEDTILEEAMDNLKKARVAYMSSWAGTKSIEPTEGGVLCVVSGLDACSG